MAAGGFSERGRVIDVFTGIKAIAFGGQVFRFIRQQVIPEKAAQEVDPCAHGGDRLPTADEMRDACLYPLGISVIVQKAEPAGDDQRAVFLKIDFADFPDAPSADAGCFYKDIPLFRRLLRQVVDRRGGEPFRNGGVVAAVLIEGCIGQNDLLYT